MALETAQDARGATPPRPFAVRPPLASRAEDDRRFCADEILTVGINLFGDTGDVFPYLCQAFDRMGQIGIGYGRGQFALERVEAVDPFSAGTVELLRHRQIVAAPGLPVTEETIRQAAADLPADRLWLRFLTPACLTHGGQRLTAPSFEALIARLLERCQAMEAHYAARPTAQPLWRQRYLTLTRRAQAVRLAEDRTRWVRLTSGSRRTGERTSISGFVGEALFEGDLGPFRDWLLWGQSLHVGKNAVKGNGWYETIQTSPL
jgi:hypothetical protein